MLAGKTNTQIGGGGEKREERKGGLKKRNADANTHAETENTHGRRITL